MAKDDVIEIEGIVTDALPNAMFKVDIGNGHTILANISGKLRMNFIKILTGAEISFVHQHLKSGIFNEDRRKISVRLRRVHQLAVLRYVYANFENGSGAVSADDVALALRVPESVLRSEIDELIDCGMVCRSMREDGEIVLLPSRPAERLTLIDFLRDINGIGDDESPELACFEKLFRDLENLIENSKYNAKIHEV